MYKKSSQNCVGTEGKKTGPPLPSREVLSLPEAWVALFLLKFRHGLMAYWEKYCFLICQDFQCCMLTSSTSFQGVLPVKTYRGAHVRYLSMTQKYGKQKNFCLIFCFLLINQPSSMLAIGNFENAISSTH